LNGCRDGFRSAALHSIDLASPSSELGLCTGQRAQTAGSNPRVQAARSDLTVWPASPDSGIEPASPSSKLGHHGSGSEPRQRDRTHHSTASQHTGTSSRTHRDFRIFTYSYLYMYILTCMHIFIYRYIHIYIYTHFGSRLTTSPNSGHLLIASGWVGRSLIYILYIYTFVLV